MVVSNYRPRQTLHLSISSLNMKSGRALTALDSPDSALGADSPSSVFIAGAEPVLCTVLCYYDFITDEPGVLSFRKNELLDIVRQMNNGWWAAMRRGGSTIGWIPEAYVRPVSLDMSDRLRDVHKELRVFEYEAEHLYRRDTKVSHMPLPLDESEVQARSNAAPASTQHDRERPVPKRSLSLPGPVVPLVAPSSEPATSFQEDVSPQTNGPRSAETQRQDRPLNPYAYQIKYELDGQVRMATRRALVEKLTVPDPIPRRVNAGDEHFRDVFLMTFRTFMRPNELFDMLLDIYGPTNPDAATEDLNSPAKGYIQKQKKVMEVLRSWLERHRLLEEEPHMAHRVTEFLDSIPQRSIMVERARCLLFTVERLTFSTPCIDSEASAGFMSSMNVKPKKLKDYKGDLLNVCVADMAEQLCLYEYRLYVKVTPHGCLGGGNLHPFTSMHDKIVNWVMHSILFHDALAKRARTIEFWINVAEKLRTLRNFSSMSAILTALSSVSIARLHVTWVNVGRVAKGHLDQLLKYNDPAGGFNVYRNAQLFLGSPCVPFVGMYLTDIAHINDRYSTVENSSGGQYVNFVKCDKLFEVVCSMLKHQQFPYGFSDCAATRNFIASNLRLVSECANGPSGFWLRSQEVQRMESANTNSSIKEGLERAGF